MQIIKNRAERKQQEDLKKARQAGTAMPEVDAVTGKSINPHIPDWMAKPSWWQDTGSGPSLKHQKAPEKAESPIAALDAALLTKGKAVGPAATKFRKGACQNCGAMTHSRRDCLERPRKQGAVWTGRGIAADEVVLDENIKGKNWDAKRDKWAGYDPANHKRVVMEHEALEEARKRFREEELDKTTDLKVVQKVAKTGKDKGKAKDEDDFGSSDESDDDEDDKYADAADAAGQKLDTKNRLTVRNLRIREDTAKYLRNLDPESAYYDPKTRSMREAPDASINPQDAVYAGDNFQRASGAALDQEKLQLFAWQAESRGQDVHVFANPTHAALVHKDFLSKKQAVQADTAESMLDKYGGERHLRRPPKELMLGQSENYVEYDRSTGALVKGQEAVKPVSKYAEDIFPGNHTSVWGSYWIEGAWGFGCCHSTIKSSYCVGAAGKAGAQIAEESRMIALQAADSHKRKADEAGEEPAAKRKTLQSGVKHHVLQAENEEEMEAYRRDRANAEDPLFNVKDGELLPL